MLPVVRFRRNLPDLADEFFGNSFFPEYSYKGNVPSVNVAENDDNFKIEVAAPGLSKEDFHVSLDNNVLTISSDKKYENGENKEQFLRKEFGYSSFKRCFGLPESADGEKITASHKNGILVVEIPKKEEAKPKPVKEISVS